MLNQPECLQGCNQDNQMEPAPDAIAQQLFVRCTGGDEIGQAVLRTVQRVRGWPGARLAVFGGNLRLYGCAHVVPFRQIDFAIAVAVELLQ